MKITRGHFLIFSQIITIIIMSFVQFLKAIEFAIIKHNGQSRAGESKDPYIVHPVGVAIIAAEAGYVNWHFLLTACICHDLLEDTNTTEAELAEKFGDEILSVVKEVSDNKTLPKLDRKRLQIEHAPLLSRPAKIVKLCDKIYNVRDCLCGENGSRIKKGWSVEQVQHYVAWANKVYLAGLKGVNEKLDAIFEDLLKKEFQYFDGTFHPALPDGWEDFPLV